MSNEISVMENTEVAEYNQSAVDFAMSVDEMEERMHIMQDFIKRAMVEGQDFGKIPGTDKPTLLKPGAEKLGTFYGYSNKVDVVNKIEDWKGGFFHYEVKVTLVNKKTGCVEAEGIGSCNSKEARYRYRWAFENQLPRGVSKEELPKKAINKNGKTYTLYRTENDDVFTLPNTLLKMAKKRAFVDATLSATRTSGIFTQDVEDYTETEIIHNSNSGKKSDMATEPQRKKLYAMAKERNISDEIMHSIITERYKKESSKELTKKEIQDLFEFLEKGEPEPEEDIEKGFEEYEKQGK